MIHASQTMKRRWHRVGRRLFFWHAFVMAACLSVALPRPTCAQESLSARILQRQARVMRNEAGIYRVIEAMLVELDRDVTPDFALREPLRLVEVYAVSGSVMGIGGDLPVTQIVYDTPWISIVGPINARVLEVAATYALPRDATALEFTARWPVEDFLVEIDRGSIDVRPAGELSEADAGGTDERPVIRYKAVGLEAGQAVGFRFSFRRVSWQQRIAVLIACSLAAGAAGLLVWRGAASRTTLTTGATGR